MAELLFVSVLSEVAVMVTDVLVQQVTRIWGVDNDRDRLERWLLAVQRILADAEVKSETDPIIKRWMKNLKAVTYQTDDVLDDFRYEALHCEAQSHMPMTSKAGPPFAVLPSFTRAIRGGDYWPTGAGGGTHRSYGDAYFGRRDGSSRWSPRPGITNR